jgi:hypothetical protein
MGESRQADGLSNGRSSNRLTLDFQRRRLVVERAWSAPTGTTGAVVVLDHDVIDEIVGLERRVRALGPSVAGERPDELLVAKVLGNANAEQETVTPWKKVGWLPLIGPTRLDRVVRSDRQVDLFHPVSVEVAEHEVERPVRVLLPAFVHWSYVLTGRHCRLRAGVPVQHDDRSHSQSDRTRCGEGTGRTTHPPTHVSLL